jgi:hypothetical protein
MKQYVGLTGNQDRYIFLSMGNIPIPTAEYHARSEAKKSQMLCITGGW